MKQRGYNHNIKHLGLQLHVQTEDYGQPHGKVVTQLFCKGQLVHKIESIYPKSDQDTHLNQAVALLMQEQHKQMLVDLRDGKIVFPSNLQSEMEKPS